MATHHKSVRNNDNLDYWGVTYYESRDRILNSDWEYFHQNTSTNVYDVIISAHISKKV